MLTWVIDYWYLAAIALLIGLATGWWIWGRLGAVSTSAQGPRVAAAAPQPIATPETSAAIAPLASGLRIAPAVGDDDDLELIKGVGPTLGALLHSLGVHRFDQIAAWTAAEIAEVDGHLGSFKGRIVRDQWVEQAGYLARGDTAGFERLFGELGSEKNS